VPRSRASAHRRRGGPGHGCVTVSRPAPDSESIQGWDRRLQESQPNAGHRISPDDNMSKEQRSSTSLVQGRVPNPSLPESSQYHCRLRGYPITIIVIKTCPVRPPLPGEQLVWGGTPQPLVRRLSHSGVIRARTRNSEAVPAPRPRPDRNNVTRTHELVFCLTFGSESDPLIDNRSS
jgi:hypothetical protein